MDTNSSAAPRKTPVVYRVIWTEGHITHARYVTSAGLDAAICEIDQPVTVEVMYRDPLKLRGLVKHGCLCSVCEEVRRQLVELDEEKRLSEEVRR